ncbi:hypothetical protein, variant [Capsaspora owczarzaki ATCC 30864]|nr:hypothetical protein, variant [Capsaspora owczarzaki ATCC 30864]|eukprot:XP_011270421.1 hypothetical protein, variant [Capsaspora owczarzaki ATCC 30864]
MILALSMVVTGSVNIIMAKLQNNTTITKCTSNGTHTSCEEDSFNHPGVQTWYMFIGETLCLGVFFISKYLYRRRERLGLLKEGEVEPKLTNPWHIFLYPALCDITATTLMNIGLLFTAASVYQMLRGASVLFTALFSVLFLRRRLRIHHYIGLYLVVTGITIVGVASVVFGDDNNESSSNMVLGIVLVIAAQVVVATQFIVEEKFIGKYSVPPIAVVGSEGIFGLVIVSCILPALQYINISGKPIEDTRDAFKYLEESWVMDAAVPGYIFSIAFFNFCGVSITKFLSATHRSTIDSCRTVVVWVFSLIVGWEDFLWLQLIGFFFLVSGTFMYNEVYPLPFMNFWRNLFSCFPSCFAHLDEQDEEKSKLLVNSEDNYNNGKLEIKQTSNSAY